MSRLQFITLDVFTSTRFLGNPLAIVKVPKEHRTTLTQDQKQTIAREFNLSETVFLHESEADAPTKIDIFTSVAELPFAGHPTVGSGWYLLSQNPTKDFITLTTKAGDILVSRTDTGAVRLRVPTNFKVQPPYTDTRVKTLQPNLADVDYVHGKSGAEAVASIVKGMTFVLLQVASEDALARLRPISEHLTIPDLGEWASFVGLYAFFEREDGIIRTRMFDGALEDPATGSAASTLAGYLAGKRGNGTYYFKIIQGVEMRRRSEIEVFVEVGKDGKVATVELGGEAVEIMDGSIQLPAQK